MADSLFLNTVDALRTELATTLTNENVYYQPPPDFLFETFPVIVFKLTGNNNIHADNIVYKSRLKFQVVLMSVEQDTPAFSYLLNRQLCTFLNSYIHNGVYHSVFDIYL